QARGEGARHDAPRDVHLRAAPDAPDVRAAPPRLGTLHGLLVVRRARAALARAPGRPRPLLGHPPEQSRFSGRGREPERGSALVVPSRLDSFSRLHTIAVPDCDVGSGGVVVAQLRIGAARAGVRRLAGEAVVLVGMTANAWSAAPTLEREGDPPAEGEPGVDR